MLPLFPLSLVAFPTEPVNLHIFEPRYRELTRWCVAEDEPFGIVPYVDGNLRSWGTEMRILSIEKEYENGEMDIRTVGTRIFQLVDFHNPMPGHLFAGGNVRYATGYQVFDGEAPNTEIVLSLWRQFLQWANLEMPLKSNQEMPLSFQLGHKVGLPLEEEYLLLQIGTENHRLAYLANHLQLLVDTLEKTAKARHMISLNGHFKSINPPNL